jgi:hypothetical protein
MKMNDIKQQIALVVVCEQQMNKPIFNLVLVIFGQVRSTNVPFYHDKKEKHGNQRLA